MDENEKLALRYGAEGRNLSQVIKNSPEKIEFPDKIFDAWDMGVNMRKNGTSKNFLSGIEKEIMDSLSHPNGISDEPLKDIWGNDLAGDYPPGKGETKKEDAGNFKLDFKESEKHFPKENYLLKPQEKYDKMYLANYSNEVSSGKENQTDAGNKKSNLDTVSDLLTLASLIPGLDTVTNLASIPVDIARGDFLSAGLSAIGAIPIVGELADSAKLAKGIDKVVDTAKTASLVSDAAKNVKIISPSKLTQTHKLTLNKRQYNDIVESIRKNGITDPIKYVEYEGTKYVVDGHHRLRAAKELGLDEIPIQEVSLPYKGYKTIKDLLWLD